MQNIKYKIDWCMLSYFHCRKPIFASWEHLFQFHNVQKIQNWHSLSSDINRSK